MSKLPLFILMILFFSSCAKYEIAESPQADLPSGSREFKIQSHQSAFKVSLLGVFMGTPDYKSVWSVIEEANSQGIIDNIVQFATPFEVGIAHCIEVENEIVRNQILYELENIPTSLSESNYLIESVESCSI